ncbi:hypothetical protein [Aeromonas phage 13AhydR10PP]|nr:hypothetical protein [Aeromonas phage 13AhydR10PP]AWH15349.1 hypothetical protein [Aeromonas phage 14AhydR10PP]
MRAIILTLIIMAAMSMIAAFGLAAEGEMLWSCAGILIGFLSFRGAGWFEYHYQN